MKIGNVHNIDIVTLDFSKGFDKLPNNKLLYKLIQYGVVDKLYDWICA